MSRRGAKPKTVRQRVRLGDDGPRQFQPGIAKKQFVADLDAEALKQHGGRNRAEALALFGQKRGKGLRRLGDEIAIERIGAIDGLDLGQALL